MKIKMPNFVLRSAAALLKASGNSIQIIPSTGDLSKLTGGSSITGKRVSAESTLGLAAAFACQRIISEAIGTIPWRVYQRNKDGSVGRVATHSLAIVLEGSPNANNTPVEFRETKTLNLAQSGNCYSLKETLGNEVVGLTPLRSSRVMMKVKGNNNTKLPIQDGQVFYSVLDERTNTWIDYTRDAIWHVKGFGSDGMLGLSPIGCAREAIGMALATQEFGAQFFAQGGKPSGIVTVPNFFTKDQRGIARENLQQMMGGLGNMHKFALFEGGMKPEPWGEMPLKDMEFVALMKMGTLDMCKIFRVPPHMVAEVEKGASYASIEMLSSEFIIFTLLPYMTRFESSAGKWLLSPQDRAAGIFLHFDYDELLRADTKTHGEFLSNMVNNGIMNRNEARSRLSMNRSDAPGMDDFTAQGALLPVGKLGKEAPASKPPLKTASEVFEQMLQRK